MRKFRFSLETLLSIRREKEQEREIALAGASGELVRIDAKIADAGKLGDDAFESPASTMEELRARDRLWAKSLNDRKALEEPRVEAVRNVDEARRIYTEARIERSVLDRLREKLFHQWKAEMKREEIKRLDETAKSTMRKNLPWGGPE